MDGNKLRSIQEPSDPRNGELLSNQNQCRTTKYRTRSDCPYINNKNTIMQFSTPNKSQVTKKYDTNSNQYSINFDCSPKNDSNTRNLPESGTDFETDSKHDKTETLKPTYEYLDHIPCLSDSISSYNFHTDNCGTSKSSETTSLEANSFSNKTYKNEFNLDKETNESDKLINIQVFKTKNMKNHSFNKNFYQKDLDNETIPINLNSMMNVNNLNYTEKIKKTDHNSEINKNILSCDREIQSPLLESKNKLISTQLNSSKNKKSSKLYFNKNNHFFSPGSIKNKSDSSLEDFNLLEDLTKLNIQAVEENFALHESQFDYNNQRKSNFSIQNRMNASYSKQPATFCGENFNSAPVHNNKNSKRMIKMKKSVNIKNKPYIKSNKLVKTSTSNRVRKTILYTEKAPALIDRFDILLPSSIGTSEGLKNQNYRLNSYLNNYAQKNGKLFKNDININYNSIESTNEGYSNREEPFINNLASKTNQTVGEANTNNRNNQSIDNSEKKGVKTDNTTDKKVEQGEKVETQNTEKKRDISRYEYLVLSRQSQGEKVPNYSVEGFACETVIRALQVPYMVDYQVKSTIDPVFLTFDTNRLTGIKKIIQYLKVHFKLDLDSDFSPKERSIIRAMNAMILNQTILFVHLSRYKINYEEWKQHETDLKKLNYMKQLLYKTNCLKQLKQNCEAVGIHYWCDNSIMSYAELDIKALSTLLANKKYFFSSSDGVNSQKTRISTLDCLTFALVGNIYYCPVNEQGRLKTALRTHYRNLVHHFERMKQYLWGDWDQRCLKLKPESRKNSKANIINSFNGLRNRSFSGLRRSFSRNTHSKKSSKNKTVVFSELERDVGKRNLSMDDLNDTQTSVVLNSKEQHVDVGLRDDSTKANDQTQKVDSNEAKDQINDRANNQICIGDSSKHVNTISEKEKNKNNLKKIKFTRKKQKTNPDDTAKNAKESSKHNGKEQIDQKLKNDEKTKNKIKNITSNLFVKKVVNMTSRKNSSRGDGSGATKESTNIVGDKQQNHQSEILPTDNVEQLQSSEQMHHKHEPISSHKHEPNYQEPISDIVHEHDNLEATNTCEISQIFDKSTMPDTEITNVVDIRDTSITESRNSEISTYDRSTTLQEKSSAKANNDVELDSSFIKSGKTSNRNEDYEISIIDEKDSFSGSQITQDSMLEGNDCSTPVVPKKHESGQIEVILEQDGEKNEHDQQDEHDHQTKNEHEIKVVLDQNIRYEQIVEVDVLINQSESNPNQIKHIDEQTELVNETMIENPSETLCDQAEKVSIEINGGEQSEFCDPQPKTIIADSLVGLNGSISNVDPETKNNPRKKKKSEIIGEGKEKITNFINSKNKK